MVEYDVGHETLMSQTTLAYENQLQYFLNPLPCPLLSFFLFPCIQYEYDGWEPKVCLGQEVALWLKVTWLGDH